MPLTVMYPSGAGWSAVGSSAVALPEPGSRDGLVAGVDKPGASNTGVFPGTSFTTETAGGGTFQANVVDKVYENVDFKCLVVLYANNVTFKNCRFRGKQVGPGAQNDVLLKGHSSIRSLGGATFVDCTFDPTIRSWWMNGMWAGNATFLRCEITNVVDGISLIQQTALDEPTLVQQCWIHDGDYYSWVSPETGDGQSDKQTHNDAVQFHRGKSITVRGNTLEGFHNSGIMLQQEVSSSDVDKLDNILIEKNWFGAGPTGLNISIKYSNNLGGVTIKDNRFLRKPSGVYVYKPDAFAGVFTGNVFDDDGTPVTVTRG